MTDDDSIDDVSAALDRLEEIFKEEDPARALAEDVDLPDFDPDPADLDEDLSAMQRVGVATIQAFEGGMLEEDLSPGEAIATIRWVEDHLVDQYAEQMADGSGD